MDSQHTDSPDRMRLLDSNESAPLLNPVFERSAGRARSTSPINCLTPDTTTLLEQVLEEASKANTTSTDVPVENNLFRERDIDNAFIRGLWEPVTPETKRTDPSNHDSPAWSHLETPTASTSTRYSRSLPQVPGFTSSSTPPELPPKDSPSHSPTRSLSTILGWMASPQPANSEARQLNADQSSPASHDRSSGVDAQFAEHLAARERRIQEFESNNAGTHNAGQSSAQPSPRQSLLGIRPNNGSSFRFSPSSPYSPLARLGLARMPETPFSSGSSSQPWRPREPDFASRPDIPSRNALHTTISNVLFNFDILPDEAADLLEDACATARGVGVSTHELLSQTVTLGSSDLGMTPLCLEASRWDVGAEIELLEWLIKNSPAAIVEREIRRGCLMRNNGMGDQLAWSAIKLFLTGQKNQATFAYDVVVDNIMIIPGAAAPTKGPAMESETTLVDRDGSDDEGSLYDDASLIDAASSIDQADIETLKSSDDEGGDQLAETTAPVLGPNIRAHRARIDIPLFTEALCFEDHNTTPAYTELPAWTSSSSVPSKLLRESPGRISGSGTLFSASQRKPMKTRVLTVEWMFEGRVWALAIGEDRLVLTLRYASDRVTEAPVKVKASIRIFPGNVQWDGIQELPAIGPDMLLPTQESVDFLLIGPTYACELGESELVPGPPTLSGNTSVSKEMLSLSLLEIASLRGALKVEVIIKTIESAPQNTELGAGLSGKQKPSESGGKNHKSSGNVAEESSEWQFVDK